MEIKKCRKCSAPQRPQRTSSKPDEVAKPAPPARPPPPKIFGPEDDPAAKVILPEAPTDEPEVTMQPRNPRLYELVSLSQDTSFWWDSVDADEGLEFTGGLPPRNGDLEEQFATGLEIGDRRSHGSYNVTGRDPERVKGIGCGRFK